MQSPFEFRKHGQSGLEISSLFPHTAKFADDLCVIRSMYTDTAAHASGCLQMNTGSVLIGKPSLGSWLSYGLGTQNENLPSFVVMTDPRGGPIGSASNWTAGYMPAAYQGTLFRAAGHRCSTWPPRRASSDATQRHALDLLEGAERSAPAIASRRDASWPPASSPTSWPTGCRQRPPRWSISTARRRRRARCTASTTSCTADFGRKCLITRRLLERGVRFVQLYSGGGHIEDTWDGHNDCITNHKLHAGETDQPIAALIADLKRTGLWDETLLVWGGEFGRTPTSEGVGKPGRDHNPHGFSHVAGRRRREGRAGDRRDRRAGLQRRRGPMPRLRPARDDPAPDGPRPHQADLLLLGAEPAAHRGARSRREEGAVVRRSGLLSESVQFDALSPAPRQITLALPYCLRTCLEFDALSNGIRCIHNAYVPWG